MNKAYMNEMQQAQVTAFVANLVKLVHEEGIACEQAKSFVEMATSTLLGAILCVPPGNEVNKTFVVEVIHTTLKHFYE